MNFLEFIKQGGITIYPLLVASLVSVTVIINKFFEFFIINKTLRTLHPQMVKLTEEKNYKKMEEVLSDDIYCKNMYLAVLNNLNKPREAIKRLSEIGRHKDAAEVRRYTWLLGTVGSLAPFIGLFGTVVGIMGSFKNIAAVGSGGFSVVASGISEALISTAGGLFVGVVAIFFYNYFLVKSHYIQDRLIANEEEILIILENQSRGK